MKACTLCLQTNINVCQLGDSAAINFIQEIFVNNGFKQLSKHNYICMLCNHLLKKSYDFIQKTLRAQRALKEIVDEGTKITVATLRQIDRTKLDLDLNLICQVREVNYHLYDEDFLPFEKCNNEIDKSNPLDSKNKLSDVCFIKTEENCNQYFFGHDCDDNYENQYEENPMEGIEIKQEPSTDIEVKVAVEPFFTEVENPFNTRRDRKHVNYKEIDDDKVKTKKAKVKCEPKIENDEAEIVNTVKSKKVSKSKGRKRRKRTKPVDRSYPKKCDHCKYMIQNKTEHFHHYLLYHRGIPYPYAREGKFVCQHCGVTKTTIHVLQQHELTHGEKKVACQQCGKLFHNDTRLKRHMKRHGAVLKICDYCNKGFVAREDLILHIRTHTGQKPFKCVICGAAFAHRGNVAIHMRSRHQQEITPHTQPITTHTDERYSDPTPVKRGRKKKVPKPLSTADISVNSQ